MRPSSNHFYKAQFSFIVRCLPSLKVFARKNWRLALVALVLLGLTCLGLARWRAMRALRTAAQQVEAEHSLRVTARPLVPQPDNGFEWISSPAVFSGAARFHNHLYLCGPAGLLEYSADGALQKEFRVGRELPSSPLLRMAVGLLADARQPELLIATANDGVLAFDGLSFRQIFPADPEARTITALLPLSSSRLLIGTARRGVLVYDGKQLTYFHPTLANLNITELAGTESDLWAGTLDRGVLHWHGGQTDHFGEAEGLPDPRIYALAISGDRAYVGTAVGVSEFASGRFSRVLAQGIFARSLLVRDQKLMIGSMDEGIVEVPLAKTRAIVHAAAETSDLPDVEQLFETEGKVFALARQGLYARPTRDAAWQRVLQPGGAVLTDGNVSALAADPQGRLWVGYFDRGLDILSSDLQRAEHVENDHVFCVNRITPNPRRGMTAVATANGLVLFDANGNQQQSLGRADGIIADHVTDVALYRDGMALATPAGLTFLDVSGARSLYAFHGLVNNHVYALGVAGDRVMAGTLGGLSELDAEQVRASYTTATSALKHNWITAVVPVGDEWLVGTYGAGIVRMNSAGHFETMERANAPFEVNPNAMLATARHVFAGTLGRGFYVMDRGSSRWSQITSGLPSSNVTALAEGGGYIYIGTDNGLVRISEEKVRQ